MRSEGQVETLEQIEPERDLVAGYCYVMNLVDLRSKSQGYIAKQTTINVRRDCAQEALIDFFRKASNQKLTVCVMIHGFTSSHRGDWAGIANSIVKDVDNKIVKLYIDWDTEPSRKLSNFFFCKAFDFVTNGVKNAYNIGQLVREAIQKYDDKYHETIKCPIFVIAHSMGSHVAETFIKEHLKLNLKGVIYFNPHADQDYYRIRDVDTLYVHRSNKQGFVISFNSAHDRVLGFFSPALQRAQTGFFALLGIGMRQSEACFPLGKSWAQFRRYNKDDHRVVVHHMKLHKTKIQYYLTALRGCQHHHAFKHKAAQEITIEAMRIAMTRTEFDIDKILKLVKPKHKLGDTKKRCDGQEYVNMENEVGERDDVCALASIPDPQTEIALIPDPQRELIFHEIPIPGKLNVVEAYDYTRTAVISFVLTGTAVAVAVVAVVSSSYNREGGANEL